MATMFKAPIVRVGLADSRQRRYDVASGDEGFFVYDDMARLAKEGKLVSSYFPANTLQQFGAQNTTHVIPIDRRDLKGLLLRPLLRQPLPWDRGDDDVARWEVTDERNDFWEQYIFYPNDTDNWDFTLAEDGLLYEMTQKVSYTGDGTSLSDWIVSQVGFDGRENPESGGLWQGQAPNPFFTAGFRRQAIPPEFVTALAAEVGAVEYAATQIVWGMNPEVYPDGKWMLHCPIVGRPTLYERILTAHPWSSENNPYWEPRQWTEGDLSALEATKAAKEGYTYHIGTMGHAICVSEGGFGENDRFAYYLAEGSAEPVVPYGSVLIRNWPGQCTFWLDLNVFPLGFVQRWPVEIPVLRPADAATVILGQPFSASLQEAGDWPPDIVDALPDVEGMSVSTVELDLSETAETLASYKLMVAAGAYPEGADPRTVVVTQTSPFVEAVQFYQNADLTDNGEPTFTETTRGIVDLRTQNDLQHMTAAKQMLEISNAEESYLPDDMLPEPEGGFSPTADWRAGRQLELTHVGWRMRDTHTSVESDVTQNLGRFWLVGARRNKRRARFDVTDLLGMVALNKWNGETDLNFRGWDIDDAIAFGLELQGIGPAQYDLEDTGLTVPDDNGQNYRKGTSWLKILQGLLDRGGDIWYYPGEDVIQTGCRFCRTARTSEDVLTHADAGWTSSGCLAADVARAGAGGVDFLAVFTPSGAGGAYPEYPAMDLEVEDATLDDRAFANEITVVGSRPNAPRPTQRRPGWAWNGREIVATWRNPASVDWAYIVAHPTEADEYIGFPVSVVEHDDSIQTEQEAWRRVAELAAELTPRPRLITFTVPLLNTIRAGMVTQCQGGAFGQVDGCTFRVTGVRHNPGDARTQISAREMVTVCEG